MYHEAERTQGMQDYMSMQVKLRDGIVRELLDGTLDKYGNSRDCCKRAVLHYLNVQLGYTKSIHEQFEAAQKVQDKLDRLKPTKSST